MTPQLPASRTSDPGRPAPAVAPIPARSPRDAVPTGEGRVTSTTKPETTRADANHQRASREPGDLSVRVQRHNHWALMGRAQSQLSRLQGTEASIISSYRELLSLSRQLERSQDRAQHLQGKVQQLQQSIRQAGYLDGNLNRLQGDTRTAVLDRINLLQPRDQSERLAIRLPDSSTLLLSLPENSRQEQVLDQIRPQLASRNIQATVNDQQQLRLTGPGHLLDAPWVFRGEGVRVAAGNPVPILLGKEPDQLEQLADGLGRGDVSREKQRLRSLLATLEQERRALENQRQQLLRQVAQLQSSQSEVTTPVATETSDLLRSTLINGDFTLQLNTLLAQANISRFSVVALLGR